MGQQPGAGADSRLFAHRTLGRKLIDVVVVPVVLGAVTGATVHLPWLYWILSALAAIAAFAVGLEHRAWGPAALRGLVAGLMYGIGIAIIYYSLRHHVDVRVSPPPSAGTPLVTAIAGGLLTTLGALVLGRRAAH